MRKLILLFLTVVTGFASFAQKPSFTTTPTNLTIEYGTQFSYGVSASTEGSLITTLTAPTIPSWLAFNANGDTKAALFGSVPNDVQLSGVAGDTEGNIYATSFGAAVNLYKITPDGTTTLWKVTGFSGPIYALHISEGYIYLPFYANSTNSIYRIPLNNPVATPELFASIPGGAIDLTSYKGDIYAADYGNSKIYRINSTSKVSSVFIASGLPLEGPWGLSFDSSGDLYIATWANKSIMKYSGGTLTTVLTGLAKEVTSIQRDKNNYYYISFYGGGLIKYNPDFTNPQLLSLGSADPILSSSLTASGALVYAIFNSNKLYRVQTGALLAGIPAKANVGAHNVVLAASNSNGTTNQSFTINVVDKVAPIITTLSPLNNATDVQTNTSLKITFDEEVKLGTAGTISLFEGTSTVPFETIDLSVAADLNKLILSSDKTQLTITPGTVLGLNKLLKVQIANPSTGYVIADIYDNPFLGFTYNSGNWQFNTSTKDSQTINFPVIASKSFGDAAFTLGDANSSGGLPVTYTAADQTVVSISGNQATILKAGNTTITASQSGNGSYSAASDIVRNLTVAKANPTIGTFANVNKTYGDANYTITTPSSNGTGAITYTSSNTAVATISGTTITIVGVGTATITGTQAADNNYNSGTTTSTLTVAKANPTIGTFANVNKTYGDANYTITAPSSNGTGAITYTSSNTAVATISGSTITIVGVGTATITGTQAADNNYNSGTTTSTLTVAKANPTIGVFPNQVRAYGSAAFGIISPTSNSIGVITFTSSNTAVVTISGNTATIVGGGTATITATQAATTNYNVGTATSTLTVLKANPAIGVFADINKTTSDAAFGLIAPTTNSTGAFTYASSNTTVATISGTTVTIVGVGTTTIMATQAADANYNLGAKTSLLTVIVGDTDGDGVPDNQEIIDGTNPNDATKYKDSDGDGVPDFVEAIDGTDANDKTKFKDSDGDGVPDYIEVKEGTNTNDKTKFKDTDGDGVPDYIELRDGTNPNDATKYKDSDGDGVPDFVEAIDGTDPNDKTKFKDSDGDGVPDYIEVREGTDPNDGSKFKDSDGDGVPDYIEVREGTDPNDGSKFKDSDGDGVPDYIEIREGTDPNDGSKFKDSDGDGVPDYIEKKEGTNPNNSNDGKDSDGDGIPDYVEVKEGTDINKKNDYKDSDKDGVPDYVEVKEGTNPTLVDDFKDTDKDGLSDYYEANNQAPTALAVSKLTVLENQTTGTVIGLLSSTDPNKVEKLTYSLATGTGSADNLSFVVTGNELKTASVFNFEAKNTYNIRLRTTDAGGLTFDKEFVISVSDINEQPTIDAVANAVVCYTTAAQKIALSGITAGPESAQTTTLSVSNSNAALFSSLAVTQAVSGSADLNFTLASGAAGVATISLTVTDNGGTANGGVNTATKTFTITANALPTVSSSTAGSSCGTGPVVLSAVASAGTLNWYAAATGGSILGTGTTFTSPSISTTTTYYVEATNNNCISATRTAVIATVNVIPTITASTPAANCGAGTVRLAATASAGTINWYLAATGGSSIGTGATFTTPSLSATTTYYVDATNIGCTSTTRTAVVATINAIPTTTISSDLGNNVSKGATVKLTAAGGSALTYRWSDANGIISGQNTAELTVRPSQNTTYTVTVTNASGCQSQNQFAITLKEDYMLINLANIVTPNGDGLNDKLVIKNIDLYPNNEFKVFDRAGRLIYSTKAYANDWDATLNGSPLAEGTYYYIVDFGAGNPKMKGFISVIRD